MPLDYELLDSGDGYRLERLGNNVIARPEVRAEWKPARNRSNWVYDAICFPAPQGQMKWEKKESFSEPWLISFNSLRFELRFSNSKNIGIFPEQAQNWAWLTKIIGLNRTSLSLLNLFAYTGGATLVAAQVGASICHVDASKSAVGWANRNRNLNQLHNYPIRFIVEDSLRFLTREIKRGRHYDGVILDPPAYGHGKKGEAFRFEAHIHSLLKLCKQILLPRPKLFLLNSYAMNYEPEQVAQLVKSFYPDESLEFGELVLRPKKGDRLLSCSVYARFSNGEGRPVVPP